MILLIAGSRSITDYDLSPHIPEDTDLIVSGGASGVDELAERYADAHRISKLILRPRYDLYSRAAPIKRNAEMVEICDRVLIIWDGKSKGSKGGFPLLFATSRPALVQCRVQILRRHSICSVSVTHSVQITL